MKRRYRRRFFTSLPLVTRLRYEQRSRKTERGLLAVASVTKQKIVLYVRCFAEQVGFAKQASMIYYYTAKFYMLAFNDIYEALA